MQTDITDNNCLTSQFLTPKKSAVSLIPQSQWLKLLFKNKERKKCFSWYVRKVNRDEHLVTVSTLRNTAGIQLSLTWQLLVHLSALVSDQFDSLLFYLKITGIKQSAQRFNCFWVKLSACLQCPSGMKGSIQNKLENRSNKLQVCLHCTLLNKLLCAKLYGVSSEC